MSSNDSGCFSGPSSTVPDLNMASSINLTLSVDRCQDRGCPKPQESPEATCYCRRCNWLLCNECKLKHNKKGHIIGHRSAYKGETSAVKIHDMCLEHPEERITKVCRTCHTLLCEECPTEHCQMSPWGDQDHDIRSLRAAVHENEQAYLHARAEAERNAMYADSLTEVELEQWNQTNREGLGHTVAAIREIGERQRQKMNEALHKKVHSLCEEATQLATSSSLDVPTTITSLRTFSAEMRELTKEGDSLIQQSKVTMLKKVPDIVHKMSATIPVNIRWPFVLKVEEVPDKKSLPPSENLVANLNPPVLTHRVLKVLRGHGRPPWGLVSISKGLPVPILFEVSSVGVFITNNSGQRRQIPEEGVNGACVSRDGKLIYGVYRTVIRTFSLDESGQNVHLANTVQVPEAEYMQGAATSPTTGEFAVTDSDRCRLTFHHPENQRLTQSLEMGQRSPEPLLGHPRFLAWSQCGRDLFISDRGDGPFEASVVRLRIDPPTILWRRPFFDPWNVTAMGDRVYVMRMRTWNTRVVVLSAESGRVLDEIPCDGEVRGVVLGRSEKEHVIVSYVQD